MIYTTNPIESLNASIKRKTKSKGSFPTVESAFKMMYLATQEQQEKWKANSIRSWYEIYTECCFKNISKSSFLIGFA